MERPSISEHFAAEALQQGFEQGFKQGFEQGFKQGARERALKNILEVLTLRLKRMQRLSSSPHSRRLRLR